MYDCTFFIVQLSVRENLTVVFKPLVFCDDKTLRKLAVERLLRINRLHCRDAGDLFCLYPDIPYPKLVLVKDKIVKTYSPRL